MVRIYSREDDGETYDIDWSLVDPYPALKAAIEDGVLDDDDPEEEDEMVRVDIISHLHLGSS
jgi:hypothetical protein